MFNLETIELMLIAISILIIGYSIYMYFDQRKNIRFHAFKSKMVPLIALFLMLIAIANYIVNDLQTKDLGAGFILVVFSLTMLISKNGIGESEVAEKVI